MKDTDTFDSLPIDLRPDLDSLISAPIAEGKFPSLAACPYINNEHAHAIGRLAESIKQEMRLTNEEAIIEALTIYQNHRR